MNANDVILGSRVRHVRELEAELARVRAELNEARTRLAEWESHFALALLAARDAESRPGRPLVIVDGWNVLLGAHTGGKQAGLRTPSDLVRFTRRRIAQTAAAPASFHWLVFDGAAENAEQDADLRVSYTGGTGLHRADRLILDYLHVRRLAGVASAFPATLVTADADLAKQARKAGAVVLAPADFLSTLPNS